MNSLLLRLINNNYAQSNLNVIIIGEHAESTVYEIKKL